MRVTVCEVELAERTVRLRVPFRFGRVTLVSMPEAFARLRVASSEGAAWGVASELLVPKWFDKRPERDDRRNLDDLRRSVHGAADACRQRAPMRAFELSLAMGRDTRTELARSSLTPLAAGYGPALLDRAVLDGLCRIAGCSFFDAMKANLAGFDAAAMASDMAGFDSDAFLRGLAPRRRVFARHTVGMLDTLRESDLDAGSRVDDGLPQSLEAVIAQYGNAYFKLKLGGDVDADLARLEAIAAVLDARSGGPYRVSVDGNEQYTSVHAVETLAVRMRRTPALSRLVNSLLFIEQPLAREVALREDMAPVARHWPVIIDESDDHYDAFLEAAERGYRGVSSKQCKGLYKSLLNLARTRTWNARPGAPAFFLTGEDLSCQAGVAVQQDLALAALLGLDHVERNGHHFGPGMPQGEESRRFLAAHRDLYRSQNGRACLRIVDGEVALDSLFEVGFARTAEPCFDSMRPMRRPA